MTTSVVFMGTPDFAVPSLQMLLTDPRFQTELVLTQPDRPKGRGRALQPSPVRAVAEANGCRVLTPLKLTGAHADPVLAEARPDIAVVAAYGLLLPQAVLDWPRLGCINVHASLLPRHRGASPIAAAIREGDEAAGVSIMRMERGLDTGPVYSMREIPITSATTGADLEPALAALGATLLQETLPGILNAPEAHTPQNNEAATYARKLTKADGAMDFQLPAEALARQIRAYAPWPGSFTFYEGLRLALVEALPLSEEHVSAPGTILRANAADGLVVACGKGALAIQSLKPAGGRVMPIEAWLAGRSPTPGSQLQPSDAL